MKIISLFYFIIVSIFFSACGGESDSSKTPDIKSHYSFNDMHKFVSLTNGSISDAENDIRFFNTDLTSENIDDLTGEEFSRLKVYDLIKEQNKHPYLDIKKFTLEVTQTQIIAKVQMKSLDYSLIDHNLSDDGYSYSDFNYHVAFDLEQDLRFALTYSNDGGDEYAGEPSLMEEVIGEFMTFSDVSSDINKSIENNDTLVFTINKSVDSRLDAITLDTKVNVSVGIEFKIALKDTISIK